MVCYLRGLGNKKPVIYFVLNLIYHVNSTQLCDRIVVSSIEVMVDIPQEEIKNKNGGSKWISFLEINKINY